MIQALFVTWTTMVLVLYAPGDFAYDLSIANDPQIRPQIIPRLEMIPANGVAKYREWRGLHEKSMDVYLLWMYIYCSIFLR